MVIDTNIVIAYLNNEEPVIQALAKWFLQSQPLIISAVTYAEVLSMREATDADRAVMRQFLDLFLVIPVDKYVAEEVAVIRRSEGLKFPDAVIVATARLSNTPLVTRDKRLFKVKDLIVEEI
jgi:predicted nucleic acid-binding protein